MSEDFTPAKGVKCPLCNSSFYNEKKDEAMPTKNPEDQAHFKALDHMAQEHEDEMDRESKPFPGLIPITSEGDTE